MYFLVSLRNRLIVVTQWLWSYLLFERGARLITGNDASGAVDARGGRYRGIASRSSDFSEAHVEAGGRAFHRAEVAPLTKSVTR